MERKLPFIEKNINDINDNDTYIAISGMVINKGENSFMLDDGTGQIPVVMEFNTLTDFVRVFGRIAVNENGYYLEGEIIQDLSKIDKFLYKKVKQLLL